MTWERQPKVRRKMSRRRTRARSSFVRSGGEARKAGRREEENRDFIVAVVVFLSGAVRGETMKMGERKNGFWKGYYR